MIDTQHPITPPAGLVQEWWKATPVQVLATDPDPIQLIAAKAAQWGSDQELEACCEWLGAGKRENLVQVVALRFARRPKPPSLKELALAAHERCAFAKPGDRDTIRRALEQLSDD